MRENLRHRFNGLNIKKSSHIDIQAKNQIIDIKYVKDNDKKGKEKD